MSKLENITHIFNLILSAESEKQALSLFSSIKVKIVENTPYNSDDFSVICTKILSFASKNKYKELEQKLVIFLWPLVDKWPSFAIKIHALGYDSSGAVVEHSSKLSPAQQVAELEGSSNEAMFPTRFLATDVDAGALDRPQELLPADQKDHTVQIFRAGEGHILGRRFVLSTKQNRLVEESMYLKGNMGFWHACEGNLSAPIVHIDAPRALIIGNGSTDNYYHWLIQSIQSIIFFEKHDLLQNSYLIGPRLFEYSKYYLDMLDIENKYIEIKDGNVYKADNMYVCSAIWGDNVYKPNKELLNYMSDFITTKSTARKHAGRKVYLSRRDTQKRRILNEDEVCEALLSAGYEVLECSALSVRDQISLFYNATHVVAPHGAALANLAFAENGIRVHEIFQDTYINPCFYAIARAKRMNYSYSVHKTVDRSKERHSQDYTVEIPRLLQALASME